MSGQGRRGFLRALRQEGEVLGGIWQDFAGAQVAGGNLFGGRGGEEGISGGEGAGAWGRRGAGRPFAPLREGAEERRAPWRRSCWISRSLSTSGFLILLWRHVMALVRKRRYHFVIEYGALNSRMILSAGLWKRARGLGVL